jgi:hypothetical protein
MPYRTWESTDKDRHKEAESASSMREADTREKGTRGNRATGGNREKSTRGKGRTGSRNRHWHYPNANSRCWLDRAFSEVSGADSAPNAVGSGGSTYGKLRTNALLSSMLVAERIRGPLGSPESHRLAASYIRPGTVQGWPPVG